ncbi:Sialic acid-binding Ig-like lectin 14 [Labeo rohita]|uniref:Sialic acid-binding Ig-like lectin 14 n=1 Tax=Labeo rohita TaxID=84645 RepID=A0ABQ8L239_LABRO|nr:Sialic acid-binding Ig-like lectin 14 [Labeo rohita]
MISLYSSCTRTDVTVCFCEVDGNPFPELDWHLSGRPVTNSLNMFISEERLSSTGLRSSITLHQSLTNTSTLQCVSKNTHGTVSQLFHLFHVTPQESVYGFILDHINTDSGSVRSTVGLELYKMRQLTMKLKVQNEAADTYASLQLSAPPSEYKTLNIKKGVCCRDFNISLAGNIEALSGSCVIIKCRFEINETYDKDLTESAATGLWLKDGTNGVNNQVFNSSDPKPKFSGKITGKLHEKNCTTVFYNITSNHNGKYYFRIEGNGGLKWTYAKESTSINVIDSPPKPIVQLYVEQKEVQDQEEVLEVLEGSSVSLRCSAETLCSSPPPTLTWSSTPRIPLSESSRLQELISDLNFTATHRQHRVTFTCTITYQLQDENKTAQNNITLHVQCK